MFWPAQEEFCAVSACALDFSTASEVTDAVLKGAHGEGTSQCHSLHSPHLCAEETVATDG